MDQIPDTKPGDYYVTVQDGGRTGFLVGPFRNDHAGALAMVDAARTKAEEADPRAFWYAYGTCRTDISDPPIKGVLNELMPPRGKAHE